VFFISSIHHVMRPNEHKKYARKIYFIVIQELKILIQRRNRAIRAAMVLSIDKIGGACDRTGSEVPNAPRFKSKSNFPTDISSIEIMPFWENIGIFRPNSKPFGPRGFQSKIYSLENVLLA